MQDENIKQTMRTIASVTGLKLTDERIERDLPVYRSYLVAIENIRRVDLPLEAEPMPMVVLERQTRS